MRNYVISILIDLWEEQPSMVSLTGFNASQFNSMSNVDLIELLIEVASSGAFYYDE